MTITMSITSFIHITVVLPVCGYSTKRQTPKLEHTTSRNIWFQIDLRLILPDGPSEYVTRFAFKLKCPLKNCCTVLWILERCQSLDNPGDIYQVHSCKHMTSMKRTVTTSGTMCIFEKTYELRHVKLLPCVLFSAKLCWILGFFKG